MYCIRGAKVTFERNEKQQGNFRYSIETSLYRALPSRLGHANYKDKNKANAFNSNGWGVPPQNFHLEHQILQTWLLAVQTKMFKLIFNLSNLSGKDNHI